MLHNRESRKKTLHCIVHGSSTKRCKQRVMKDKFLTTVLFFQIDYSLTLWNEIVQTT